MDRAAGIGASEVAALAGLSPWSTPVEVWLEKVGLGRPRDETPQMQTGRDLELAILKLGAQRLSRRIVHNARTFPHRAWPDVPLFATPDGFGPGRLSLAEVKVVSHRLSDWTDGPPPYVALQVQAQMSCYPKAGAVDVIALVGGEVRTYRVDRDPAGIAALEQNVRAWWQAHIVGETAPPPTTPDDEWALLRALVQADGHERLATTDEQVIARDLVGFMAERTRLDKMIDAGRLALATASEGHDLAGVGWSGRWQSARRVDWKAVQAVAAIPDEVVEGFTRTSSSFVIRRTADAEARLAEGEFA